MSAIPLLYLVPEPRTYLMHDNLHLLEKSIRNFFTPISIRILIGSDNSCASAFGRVHHPGSWYGRASFGTGWHMPLPLLAPWEDMRHPLFKMGSFCQNTLKMGVFDFRRFSKDRIYSQKTGFETRVFGNTRLLGDLRQNMPLYWLKMIPNGTF